MLTKNFSLISNIGAKKLRFPQNILDILKDIYNNIRNTNILCIANLKQIILRL